MVKWKNAQNPSKRCHCFGPKSFNVPQSAECSLADSYSYCPVITCSPRSPVLQAPQSLFGPLSMPPLSPLSAALAADITSWGIFVFNALPSTHIRTKPTALLWDLRAMYFPIRTIIPVHQYKFRLCCAQLCPTLCNPMDCACQAPLSMEFSRQEYQSRLPFPPPGDLPDPGVESVSLTFPELAGRFFTTVPHGKPQYKFGWLFINVCLTHKIKSPISVETIAVLFIIVT